MSPGYVPALVTTAFDIDSAGCFEIVDDDLPDFYWHTGVDVSTQATMIPPDSSSASDVAIQADVSCAEVGIQAGCAICQTGASHVCCAVTGGEPVVVTPVAPTYAAAPVVGTSVASSASLVEISRTSSSSPGEELGVQTPEGVRDALVREAICRTSFFSRNHQATEQDFCRFMSANRERIHKRVRQHAGFS